MDVHTANVAFAILLIAVMAVTPVLLCWTPKPAKPVSRVRRARRVR